MCSSVDVTTTAPTLLPAVDAGVLILRIDKMNCPTEEPLIRKKLEGMKGLESLDFNFLQR